MELYDKDFYDKDFYNKKQNPDNLKQHILFLFELEKHYILLHIRLLDEYAKGFKKYFAPSIILTSSDNKEISEYYKHDYRYQQYTCPCILARGYIDCYPSDYDPDHNYDITHPRYKFLSNQYNHAIDMTPAIFNKSGIYKYKKDELFNYLNQFFLTEHVKIIFSYIYEYSNLRNTYRPKDLKRSNNKKRGTCVDCSYRRLIISYGRCSSCMGYMT